MIKRLDLKTHRYKALNTKDEVFLLFGTWKTLYASFFGCERFDPVYLHLIHTLATTPKRSRSISDGQPFLCARRL